MAESRRDPAQTLALLGQVAAFLDDYDVFCHVRSGDAIQLPELVGEDFILHWQPLDRWSGSTEQFGITRSFGISQTEGFLSPFAPKAIGRTGHEDAALMARMTVSVLRGEVSADWIAHAFAFPQDFELLGTFIGGSFLVPFLKAFGTAAGQDAYAALKKRFAPLQKRRVTNGHSSQVDDDDSESKTTIIEPTTGTRLIVVRNGTIDDVARDLAKFTPEQIAGKKLIWREDISQFEVTDGGSPINGANPDA